MLESLFTSFLLASTPAQDMTHAAPRVADERPSWEFALSAFYVDPPGSDQHATTILYADRGPLHLEARYNYEDLDTASLFAGWTFEVGEELHAAITPMVGGIFGDTNGVAPALLLDVGWSKLTFYSEAEYVFDTDDSDEDYFYSWSTLTWRFSKVLAAGLVSERSKIVDTDLELQRGLTLQVTPGPVGFSLYVYNPASDDAYYTLSMDLSF
ncbi:MAG: hypothetical protein NTY35_02810 [Planctomycetota bacterium]|nr:hypothetical protein [Planctomycetota bacterium]